MKQIFACEICNKNFDNKVDCKLHENEHKNKVAWQRVYLRHENGKWIFDYSKPQYNDRCNIIRKVNIEFPIFLCSSECSADQLDITRSRLKEHALSWYKKIVEELEALETH